MVLTSLKRLDINETTGSDGIPVRLLKETADQIAPDHVTQQQSYLAQCAKASKLLGFVRRASRYIQSTQTRRTLYLSIVRCHLGYATQVWSPQSLG